MAKTPPPPAPNDAPAADPAGKGRPTPSRAEQEAARKRPLVVDTKEARARAKGELADKREKARIGLANGDERYLTARDKGPQRRFARDWVDARFSIGEIIMPLMVVVIIVSFANVPVLQVYAFLVLWAYVFLVIAEMVITVLRVKRAVARRFGADRVEKGVGLYAGMRQVQMRFMRLPKPQVKRGQRPD